MLGSRKIKYITFINEYGHNTGIVFPDTIQHITMAKQLKVFDDILGAGFCEIGKCKKDSTKNVINCFGNSFSLNKDVHKLDSSILSIEYFGTFNIDKLDS